MKKMITNMKALVALLMVGAAVTSCSSDDSIIDQPDAPQVYTMTVEASKGTNGTRALADGGTTQTSTWTAGDVVEVWTADGTTKKYGELTAQTAGASTTLRGTLSSPLPSNDETLTLKYLSPSYGTQDGTLTGSANSIDNVCDYATATVKATVSGTSVTTTTASFVNQQAVVKFTLKSKADDSALSATVLKVTAGGNTYTVTPASAVSVLYVAVPAINAEEVSLTATVGEDTYSYTNASVTFANGNFYRITVKMTKQGGASEGALSGKFSVSDSKQVYFSKGNLQYDANAATKWYFAEHQYDYIGSATGYPMDLFTWGNIANPTYDGTTYYTANSDLSGDTDWGSNIGEGWYTLSQAEWDYLFNTRTNAAAKYGYATVNSVYGIIILPDVFTDPNKNNGSNAFVGSTTTGWNANVYTSENWAFMEDAGAVFLPAAGSRIGSSVGGVGSVGFYWSSSPDASDVNSAYYVYFYSGLLDPAKNSDRFFGYSVRLVRQ